MNLYQIVRKRIAENEDFEKQEPIVPVVNQITLPWNCVECDKLDTDPIIGVHWCYDMKTYHNLLHLKRCPKEPPF